ncbi:hypothetical protein NA57DRAFT_70510 [Rhizodiscina lignyota]|uniref:Uncharacterized protein n=1 Tax=Rhizodiscina lignyota TaxID=1504668 RepID=A0A9P4IQM7_9PEZI|nr:hypothetical protein NA57DRAFT_70510 [Rhizodiscina lignyota]
MFAASKALRTMNAPIAFLSTDHDDRDSHDEREIQEVDTVIPESVGQQIERLLQTNTEGPTSNYLQHPNTVSRHSCRPSSDVRNASDISSFRDDSATLINSSPPVSLNQQNGSSERSSSSPYPSSSSPCMVIRRDELYHTYQAAISSVLYEEDSAVSEDISALSIAATEHRGASGELEVSQPDSEEYLPEERFRYSAGEPGMRVIRQANIDASASPRDGMNRSFLTPEVEPCTECSSSRRRPRSFQLYMLSGIVSRA